MGWAVKDNVRSYSSPSFERGDGLDDLVRTFPDLITVSSRASLSPSSSVFITYEMLVIRFKALYFLSQIFISLIYHGKLKREANAILGPTPLFFYISRSFTRVLNDIGTSDFEALLLTNSLPFVNVLFVITYCFLSSKPLFNS